MTDRQPDRTADPFRNSLEEWDGEYPESWIPKPGEVLVGQVVRYDHGHTTYGRCHIAVILDEDSGEERSVWLLHEVLRREFAEQRPQVGERVGLKRLPDARNSAGQPYQKWALRVDRAATPPPELEGPALDADAADWGSEPAATPPTSPSASPERPDLSVPDDDLPF